jgi:nucleotide-binding universal stress UspA family protein
MKSIVVGTDGSDSSLKAVEEAADLASATGGQLHIACVARLSKSLAVSALAPTPLPDAYDTQGLAAADAAVAKAKEVAEARGATTQGHVLEGEPANALLDLCERLPADLLVVGNKGMSGAARFLLGSVPNRCAHHAPCSVLIVRST